MSEIDARNFGRLEAEVESLKAQLSELREDVKQLLELANRSKGGFWVGMTVAASIGSVIGYVVDRFK